jgi:3-oxoacyl-[acyl-carrier protein] reductase
MDLNLKERTALIYGPFSTTVQSLMMGLTQMGADCVLLSTDNSNSQRFCSQINDTREINPKFGRALSLKNPLRSENDVKDAIGTAAQSFGSVDLYIDAMLMNRTNQFKIGEPLTNLDEDIHQNLKVSLLLTHAILNFLKSRKRGRVLYLMNEVYPDPVIAASRGALVRFSENLAKQIAEHNITVNTLSLGLTEEWVLSQYPEAKSIKEAVEILKAKDPSLRITEPDKVTNAVSFLLGQAGAALSGQHIRLT